MTCPKELLIENAFSWLQAGQAEASQTGEGVGAGPITQTQESKVSPNSDLRLTCVSMPLESESASFLVPPSVDSTQQPSATVVPFEFLEQACSSGTRLEVLGEVVELKLRKLFRSIGVFRKQSFAALARAVDSSVTEGAENLPIYLEPVGLDAIDRYLKLLAIESTDEAEKEQKILTTRMVHPRTTPYLVVHDNIDVGICAIHSALPNFLQPKTTDQKRQAELLAIYDLKILEPFRGQGFARQIIHKVRCMADHEGFRWLGVFALPEVKTFYLNQNFEHCCTIERWAN